MTHSPPCLSIIPVLMIAFLFWVLLGLCVVTWLFLYWFSGAMTATNTMRQKIAINSWSPPREGNIFGKVRLDVRKTLSYIEDVRNRTGKRVTLTHIVAKSVGKILREIPQMNGRIVLNKFVPHPRVEVALLVALEQGRNLGKLKITDVDTKTLEDIATEVQRRASNIRGGQDKEWELLKKTASVTPSIFLFLVMRLAGWLSSCIGINLPILGLTAFPFGSCVITNVGAMGVDSGFAPFTPFFHVPMLVVVGAVKDKVVVEDGEITVRPCLNITATIDHRYMDGAQAVKLVEILKECAEDPEAMEARTRHV